MLGGMQRDIFHADGYIFIFMHGRKKESQHTRLVISGAVVYVEANTGVPMY